MPPGVSYISTARLDGTRFIVCYKDNFTATGRSRIGTVSGGAVTWGPEHVFDAARPGIWNTVVALSETKVAILYDGNADGALVRAGAVSGNGVTWGAVKQINIGVGGISTSRACALDANTFVACYRNWADGQKGHANVCTVSGLDVTAGPISEFNASATALIAPVKLTASRVLVVYRDAGDSHKGKVKVGTVSGNTVTWGAVNEFFAATPGTLSATALLPTKVLIMFVDFGGGKHADAKVGTISGDGVTFGAAFTVEAVATEYLTTDTLTADYAVMCWESGGASGKWTVASVRGAGGSVSTPQQFDSGAAGWNSAVVLDLPTAVVCYSDGDDSDNLNAVVLDTGIIPMNSGNGWWGPGAFGSDDEEG